MTNKTGKPENLKAIILAGGRDFGRCPLATKLPPALWPLADKSVLERLLLNLASQGITNAVICCNSDPALFETAAAGIDFMNLEFLAEQLPVGTAGCIRDALGRQSHNNQSLVVLSAGITRPPKLKPLIEAHDAGHCDLTVLLNPPSQPAHPNGPAAEVYLCHQSIREHITKQGYCDLKESLIPTLLRAGKNLRTVTLKKHVGNFRNHAGYLSAVAEYLHNANRKSFDLPVFKENQIRTLWTAADCTIDPTARIYGPVVIMDRAVISKAATILGPAIIGSDSRVGQNSLIANSVIFNNAELGRNCRINTCVLDHGTTVPNNAALQAAVVPHKRKTFVQNSLCKTSQIFGAKTEQFNRLVQNHYPKLKKLANYVARDNNAAKIACWAGGVILAVAFAWSYWPGIIDLSNIWQQSDEYSSGLLVPFLAVYVLWSRRDTLARRPVKPSLWGLVALLVAQAFRYFGLFFMYGSAERLSIIMTIAAVVLLLFGWRIFGRALTSLIFLGLMLPLPRSVHAKAMIPLQAWATSSAVFCLEVIGYNVIKEGNVIHINDTSVAVAEACNGLRMITAFFVITGLVVLLARRAWWVKLIVLVSSVPIALFCNSLRLTATAIAFTLVRGEHWERMFHDFGGYAMMPLALLVVVGELWLLRKLVSVPMEKQVIVAARFAH